MNESNPRLPIVENAEIETTLMGGHVAKYPCPHCGTTLKSKPREIGKPDTCPHCGQAFILANSVLTQINLKKRRAEEEAEQKKEQKNRQKAEREAERERKQDASAKRRLQEIEQIRNRSEQEFQEQRSSLIDCSVCGAEISDRASKCPRCGQPQSEVFLNEATLIGGFGVLVTVYFLFFFSTAAESGNGQFIHNIGLLNDRLCGLLTGIGIFLYSGIRRV